MVDLEVLLQTFIQILNAKFYFTHKELYPDGLFFTASWCGNKEELMLF
ncbi:MAG: hypothetical protein SGJ00_15215 [bacterium]|nr:hypothetical protein [bacterium]